LRPMTDLSNHRCVAAMISSLVIGNPPLQRAV
jgi:hypothetical protein